MNIDTWALVRGIAGPVFAVQIERFLARRRAAHGQLWIFKTLMRTRATTLSVEHVEALNSISLEFNKDVEGMKRWRAYLDLLTAKGMPQDIWIEKRNDLLIALLEEHGKVAGL